MKDNQKYVYYGIGKSVDAIKLLPQAEMVYESGYDLLLLKDDVDEFMIKMIGKYQDKEFKNVCTGDLGIEESVSETDKEISDYIKEQLADKVSKVKVTTRLKNHAVCLSTEGMLSAGMEKVLNSMPQAQKGLKSEKVLEINANHAVFAKIKDLYAQDKLQIKDLAEVLLQLALLIEGIQPENPTDFSDKVCFLLS